MSRVLESKSEPWLKGSCEVPLQHVMRVLAPTSSLVFVSVPPGMQQPIPQAHMESTVHLLFTAGVGRVRMGDAGGKFRVVEVVTGPENRWIGVGIEPGTYFQVSNGSRDATLDYFMTSAPAFDKGQVRDLTLDQASERGWEFPFGETI